MRKTKLGLQKNKQEKRENSKNPEKRLKTETSEVAEDESNSKDRLIKDETETETNLSDIKLETIQVPKTEEGESIALIKTEDIIVLSSEDEKPISKDNARKSKIQKKKVKKLKVTRKDNNQPTLRNFFKSSGSSSYFVTHKESSFPVIVGNEDLNMSSFLDIHLSEGDKSLSESQILPKEDPECITENFQFEIGNSNVEQLNNLLFSRNLEPEKNAWNLEENLIAVHTQVSDDEENENFEETGTGESAFGTKKNNKKVVVPKYKIIEGSTFAVDAFRYGDISNVTHYFLTHYHADHYIGLTKKFQHPLYLSKITAFLVLDFIHVEGKYLHIVEVNSPFYINDVRIIPIDANHCPGAVIFLFQFKDGRQILHTGDFRANDEMVDTLRTFNYNLDLLYLDTTYLHTKRCFPSQKESIEFLITHVKKYLYDNIGEKFLILCGSYLVGKEKIWKALSKEFNFKVYLEKERRKAFESICSASKDYLHDINLIVDDPAEADIHVVNMIRLTYTNLKDFLRENVDNYSTILGVVPSGWENQKYTSGKISMLHVQYSEHSSYDELEKFVCATTPKRIISTVPISSNQSKTSEIPKAWLQESVKLRKKTNQTHLENMLPPS